MTSAFDQDRQGTGTGEWSEKNFNIGKGCSCDCLYCYARWMAMFYKRIRNHEEWVYERYTDNAFKAHFPLEPGVIMFPSTHNLSMFYLQRALPVLKSMLAAGNHVLIVTKPELEVIRVLVGNLSRYRDQILFRFTIGSLDEGLTRLWEPGASAPCERLEALSYAYAAGYQTSISIEPMLVGVEDALKVVEAVSSCVTETVWIGKMKCIKRRVIICTVEIREAVELVKRQQSDIEILRLYNELKSNEKIRWKDSIDQVLKRNGIYSFIKTEGDNSFSDISQIYRINLIAN